MSNSGQIYHNSGNPPLLYYKGTEIVGGAIESMDPYGGEIIMKPNPLPTFTTYIIAAVSEYNGSI